MKKALVFFLALVMVMSLILPAYAVSSPYTNPYKAVWKMEGCKCSVVLWRDRAALTAPKKASFEAAKESLKEAVPEGFVCRDLVYQLAVAPCGTCDMALFMNGSDKEITEEYAIEWMRTTGNKACAVYDVEMSIEGVTEVVVMQYVNKEWVKNEVTVDGDAVLLQGVVDGPMAICTK